MQYAIKKLNAAQIKSQMSKYKTELYLFYGSK
jgi:hypothetical protein